ncbi:MAG TPA: hypothetical protein VGB17_11655 [Pyrinomonadaceae bacterium]|jgi:hypothetical protein
MPRNLQRPRLILFALVALLPLSFIPVRAQTNEAPLSSQELVRLVYQLPKNPEKRDEVVEQIRRRGIGFALTDGMRGVVASKSGNDPLLRRTLEEAERRRLNPKASALPAETEWRELLLRSKTATLAAAAAMPDFIVKQQITRSYALGQTNNWIPADRLTLAVSYRASMGEQYRLIAVNGLPPSKDVHEGQNYTDVVGGSTSAGEYVSILSELFADQTQTVFKLTDTDLLRGRRALVYEFQVRKENSQLRLKSGEQRTIAAYHGRVWIDRENYRVLRFEYVPEPAPGFPITAASVSIDYDWVTINERQYLLPSLAEVRMSYIQQGRPIQDRNEIRFRNYQKFGAEVKIIEDVDETDLPPEKP